MKIRRTITIIIEGERDRVNAVASEVSTQVPIRDSDDTMRYMVQYGIDLLDERGRVVPASEIVAALRVQSLTGS